MNKKKMHKPRKQVRCTLCTPWRWMGNAKDRFKRKDRLTKYDKREMQEA